MDHLKRCDKQATSNSSKFLDYCRDLRDGKISKEKLLKFTVELGFSNVIDAFHNVHGSELPVRFFVDERKSYQGIRLTENFYKLTETFQYINIPNETEARWRLVETAWTLNLPRNLVQIVFDETSSDFLAVTQEHRIAVTGSRDALNGYQKGKCFYCYKDISVDTESEKLGDIDHFFPWKLRYCSDGKPINGVSNLVLACKECNRGENGKFDRLPSISLLDRLFRRNEYLIVSHHPLRETLIAQTGRTRESRRDYLQDIYNCSRRTLIHNWEPLPQSDTTYF